MKFLRIIFAFSFLFIAFSSSPAQEIKATVEVNVDQLTFESRNYVSSMKRDLENYINTQTPKREERAVYPRDDWDNPHGNPIGGIVFQE